MNKKNMLKKTLAVGIIFLFIGVSYSSAFVVETKSPIVSNQSEEDCGCEVVSNPHLVRLERLLNRLEVYTKMLLVLSKYHSEVVEEFEELSDRITSLKGIRNICSLLSSYLSFTPMVNHQMIQQYPHPKFHKIN